MWRVLLLALLISVMLSGCGTGWTDGQRSTVSLVWASYAASESTFGDLGGGAKQGAAEGLFGTCMRNGIESRWSFDDWDANVVAYSQALRDDGTFQSCVDSSRTAAQGI